ncbi:Protein PIN-likeS 2 [Vitis vinifera]|uniref:Protein PIN-likeS 2 n=1 Tax=Vitis vinifera TaxID=29760 RepID=A0A438JUP1_VITVI|nr:Protein PIN-likeS 2 [Vitis vinifera]
MESSREDLVSAVVPLLKLLSLTVIGLVLAHPKTQMIPRSTFKLLSKLVFALFLPCLIFTNLGQFITLENFTFWWFVPVNVLLVNNISRPLLVEAEWPGIEDKETEHSKTPFIAGVFNSISNLTMSDLDLVGETGNTRSESIRCFAEPKVVRRMRVVAEQTPIKHILATPNNRFSTSHHCCLEILAGAMVPSVMLVLGGMLAEGPNDSKLGLRTTIGISVARLLVLPLLGIGIVFLADKLNFLVPW